MFSIQVIIGYNYPLKINADNGLFLDSYMILI